MLRIIGSLIYISDSFSAISYINYALKIGLLSLSIFSAMLWTLSWISSFFVIFSSNFYSVLGSFLIPEHRRPTRAEDTRYYLATSTYDSYSVKCERMMLSRSVTESYFRHRFLYSRGGILSAVSSLYLSNSPMPSVFLLQVE